MYATPPFSSRARRAGWVLRVASVLLLLPALLFSGGASAQSLLRCEVMRTLHTSSCCPSAARSPLTSRRRSGARGQDSTPCASASRASCCTEVEVQSGLPSASVQASREVAPPWLAAVQPVALALGSRRTLARPSEPRPRSLAALPRSRSGPSLIVLLRRFLI